MCVGVSFHIFLIGLWDKKEEMDLEWAAYEAHRLNENEESLG